MADYRVNVFEDRYEKENVVARVRYNNRLDYWDGRNKCNGGTGMHKGLTKLKDGRFVIIIGSQWQGAKDYAYIVSDREALDEILQSEKIDILDTIKFKSLKKLYESSLIQEEEDEEDEE